MSKRYRYDPETDEVTEVGQLTRSTADWKPLHCEAMAFDGGTIQEAKDLDARIGAPDVSYDGNNCPVFTSKGQYDRYLKAHGYVNKTSGKGHHHLSKELLERIARRVSE
jgi:hypothetical protein